MVETAGFIDRELVVIGAGPTGLACGLEAVRTDISHVVVDKATIVNTIVGYPTYMTFFSTSERLEIGGVPFPSTSFRPSRLEALEYYRGVARNYDVELSLHNRVIDLQRDAVGRFIVRGEREDYRARFVVLATGYFDHVNRLGVPGENLPKVHHYYREPFEFYRQDVLVIGGRNSAVETALDLYRHGARVTMVHRQGEFGAGVKYWLRPDIENRIREDEITMYWNSEVVSIAEGSAQLRTRGSGEAITLENDAVFAMIGYRPDAGLLDACGIAYDSETLVPEYDPVTFETNVHNLFLAGSVACGCKTWEIFIENGREHAVAVVREIARRLQRVR